MANTSQILDPQWPKRWGRYGDIKPVIIQYEPSLPLGGAAALLILACLFIAGQISEVVGDTDTWIGMTILGAIVLFAFYLLFCAPRAIITKMGIHVPGRRSFFPWDQIDNYYAGRDENNYVSSRAKQAPDHPQTCFVFDVRLKDGEQHNTAWHDVSFAPKQAKDTDRYYIIMDGSFYSPQRLLEAIEQQRNL